MPDLLDGIARYLDANGLVDYDPTGATGDCFLEAMPQTQAGDLAVVLTLYDGMEADSKLPYDEPRLQVRVRGTPDPRVSRARAQGIYSQLNGLGPIQLPDGTRLQLCYAMQTPASMGIDSLGRHEHTTNYQVEIVAPTVHRPL